jgi:hypothetical protein
MPAGHYTQTEKKEQKWAPLSSSFEFSRLIDSLSLSLSTSLCFQNQKKKKGKKVRIQQYFGAIGSLCKFSISLFSLFLNFEFSL